MATLHFISGKAGSGKTTLARELGRTLPAIVFCEDEWISTLGFDTAHFVPPSPEEGFKVSRRSR